MTQREPEFDDDDVADLLAHVALDRSTGRYGESLEDAMSEKADLDYTQPDAIRFIPKVRVNHAEAAVERFRKELGEDVPAGAQFYVERRTFDLPADAG